MTTRFLTHSDQECIDAFRKGDDKIIQDFYDRAFTMSYSVIKNLGIKDESVSEIYQDSFCVLYEKVQRSDFELTFQLTTYLTGICKNKAKRFYREQFGHEPLSLDEREISISIEEDDLQNDYEQIEEAKRTLFVEEFKRMKANKKDCYSLIKLSYLDGKSSDSIAKILGKASGDVVKTQKGRCLSYLKKAIFKRM